MGPTPDKFNNDGRKYTMDPINLSTIGGIYALVFAIAQLVGRVIPDTAPGPLGVLRQVAKVIGLYVPNKTA
jgi:hypothetical protein